MKSFIRPVRQMKKLQSVSESGESEVVETSYNPDDLLSPYSLNISSFADNVTQEFSSTRIFATEYGIDYKILQASDIFQIKFDFFF